MRKGNVYVKNLINSKTALNNYMLLNTIIKCTVQVPSCNKTYELKTLKQDHKLLCKPWVICTVMVWFQVIRAVEIMLAVCFVGTSSL